MANSVITHFSKICTEAKAVVDIYTEAVELSASTHRKTTHNQNNPSTPSQDVTMFLGTDLLWQFIYRFTHLLEILCQSNNCFVSNIATASAASIHTFSYFDLSTYPLFATTAANSNNRHRGASTNQIELLPSTDFEKGK